MTLGEYYIARRTLTVDAVRLWPHFARGALTACLLIAIAQAAGASDVSAAGEKLLHSLLLFSLIFLSINAIYSHASLIAEEREAGALALLQLAGVNSIALLSGKMLAALVESLLLLAVLSPLMQLAETLGGVTIAQIRAAQIALASYLWLLACVGLAASVLYRPASAAARWIGVFLVLYGLAPFLFSCCLMGRLPYLEQLALPTSLLLYVATPRFGGELIGSGSVLAILLGGGFLFVAWRGLDDEELECEAERESAEEVPAEPVLRKRMDGTYRVVDWKRPLEDLDYLFLCGGDAGVAARLFVYGLAAFLSFGMFGDLFIGGLVAGCFSLLAAAIDATWTVSRLFSREIQGRTWSTLTLTPHTVSSLVRQKIRGWAKGIWPSLVFPAAFFFLSAVSQISRRGFAVEMLGEAALIAAVAASFVIYLQALALASVPFGPKVVPVVLAGYLGGLWLAGSFGAFDAQKILLHPGATLLAMGCLCAILLEGHRQLVRQLERLAGAD